MYYICGQSLRLPREDVVAHTDTPQSLAAEMPKQTLSLINIKTLEVRAERHAIHLSLRWSCEFILQSYIPNNPFDTYFGREILWFSSKIGVKWVPGMYFLSISRGARTFQLQGQGQLRVGVARAGQIQVPGRTLGQGGEQGVLLRTGPWMSMIFYDILNIHVIYMLHHMSCCIICTSG